MSGQLRVFLSSTCIDLFQERRDVAREVIGAGHTVLMSEAPQGFPVSPFLTIISNCFDAIEHHSDVLVLVISSRYGSVSSSGNSVTEDEYRKAKELGLPIFVFVRKAIKTLLPIYHSTPATDFAPVVEDNRVLKFLSEITSDEYGWVFEFEDAQDIANELKFQMSCLTKSLLGRREKPSDELLYTYTNNYTTLLNSDGLCLRKLEYEILNDTDETITRISLGDASDIPIDAGEERFTPIGSDGSTLDFDYVIQNPGYRRWDVVMSQPVPPGQKTRFHCTYLSGDIGAMDTGHQRRTNHGLITYFWPQKLIRGISSITVRDDREVHELDPNQLVFEGPDFKLMSFMYNDIGGKWRFRVSWD